MIITKLPDGAKYIGDFYDVWNDRTELKVYKGKYKREAIHGRKQLNEFFNIHGGVWFYKIGKAYYFLRTIYDKENNRYAELYGTATNNKNEIICIFCM